MPKIDLPAVIKKLKQLGQPAVIAHKQILFAISADNCLAIDQKDLKLLAKEIGINSERGVATSG